MVEPIDLLFGLWTRVGQSKHQFNHIRQVAPMCTISIVFARWHQCTGQYSAVSSARVAEPIDLLFGLWTREGRRKHKFNHIRQVAPMCPDGRVHWHHLENMTKSSICSGDVLLCQITLTTCSTT